VTGSGASLRQRDDGALELRVNGVFVMDTVETSSERALARDALALHDAPATVLVGGLGLGFTLAELLTDYRVERAVVAELDADVIGWLRDGTVPHGPELLADPRVDVRQADVAAVIADSPDTFDLILLDVDNGPDNLVHQANAQLYRAEQLRACHRALRPAGALVIWSAAHSSDLEEAMRAEFGSAIATSYEVNLQGRAEHYWLHSSRVP
jgi:spermidine synthase